MIPATEAPLAHDPKRPRVNRATLDPTVAALLESMDDSRDMTRDEIRAIREDFRQELRGLKRIGWAGLGGFFTLQVLMIIIFAQLLGVDVRETAAATREIVSASTSTTIGTDAAGEPTTTVTTTTPAAPPPAATDAPEAPPTGPTDTEN